MQTTLKSEKTQNGFRAGNIAKKPVFDKTNPMKMGPAPVSPVSPPPPIGGD
jgi:hypothetical protein